MGYPPADRKYSSRFFKRPRTAPIIPSRSPYCRFSLKAPDSSLEMSSRLPTTRLRRSASSQPESINSSLVCSSSGMAPVSGCSDSRKLDKTPVIVARGVRRSCEIELNRAFCSRSVSKVNCAVFCSSNKPGSFYSQSSHPAVGFQQFSLFRIHQILSGKPLSLPVLPPNGCQPPSGKSWICIGKVSVPLPAGSRFSMTQATNCLALSST